MRVRERAGWLGAALAAALVLGFLGRGNWLHQVLSLGALVWVGAPLLGVLGFALWKRRAGAAWVSGALLAALGLQLGIGLALLRWDVSQARRYCESLLPILDEIHAERGAYPLKLGDDARIPVPGGWFDADLIHYSSDGASFSFDVHNPAELFAGYLLHHDRRQWEEWVD